MPTEQVQKDMETARHIACLAAQRGGRTFYVGGFVRDALMGRPGKDVDVEIHGLTPAQVAETLDEVGERITVGESFGIFGLKGCSIDVAMPRREKRRGDGHRDFEVCVDPFIGTRQAAIRRDFTVNAMMQDVLTGELIDHFGGRSDLQTGILRHVSDETFAEDALRVLRAAQFAARFGFEVAEETMELCRGVSLSGLSRERVDGELRKALLQADRPSIFFETLRRVDRLDEWFPEVKALLGVAQPPSRHAEGDAWTHTMLVLDAAAGRRERTDSPLGFMLGALTHDLGKVVCTREIDGQLHAYGHEIEGVPIAERLLSRLTNERKLIDYALNLVKNHMRPNICAQGGASVKSTNRMFDEAVDPEALIDMAVADGLGQKPQPPVAQNEAFLRDRLAVYREYMARPGVAGRDLTAAGLNPGAWFTELLAYAHKLQLAGVEKESALKQTLAYARKMK